MRKLVVGALTAGAVVASGGTALAGPPEIQQKSCEDGQGVFTREHGMKTCTTTVVETRTFTSPLPPQQFSVSSRGVDLVTVLFTGTSQVTADYQVTTVRTQKGNGEVTTTQTEDVLGVPTVVPLTCHVRGELLGNTVLDRTLNDPSVCTHPQDYLDLEALFVL